MFGNRKNYILFFKKKLGTFNRFRKKRLWFGLPKKSYSFKKEAYKDSFTVPTYEFKNKTYYAFDSDSRQRLFFDKDSNPEVLDELADATLERGIVKQLTSNLTGASMKMSLIWLIVGLIIGITGTFTVFYFM